MSRGLLIIISGPSGVGKSTVVRRLLSQEPGLRFSVSATTRPPRPRETEGVNYFFVSKERFLEMIAQNKLLEYAQYVGNYYGTPVDAIEEMLRGGYDVLLDIEVQGARQIMERNPEAVSLFILPPNFQELKNRLVARGDTKEIEGRLARAKNEYAYAKNYNYIIINDQVDNALSEIRAVIKAEKCRAPRRSNLIEEV